ncbi:exopolyphosphatase [Paraneptunicella aestuarii]|uniref:exopolyphosphatase n=1 Tax=Paraneptunicella aestuarii TaxID=2831148 RepID=UPI001E3A4641|nr:exopolyphosphatase [Paraneptunicella aestuarii]UAA37988.1 exopolyphosphatase [Paraneptunicella aestuarii]
MTEFENAFDSVATREVTKVAALDIGSNSFHLVIARIVAGSVQILHRVKQKVRLAEGLDERQILSDEAIQRGLEALQTCKESMQGFNPDTVRIVATHTLRRARNADVFIKAARQIIPYPVEVISGVEEARLIYLGVAHTSAASGKRLIIDIGGGSTEFIIGKGFDPLLLRSVKMGCVSFTHQFFKEGELKSKAFKKAITAAQQELEIISDRYRSLGWKSCLGSSGTIRTIANLISELNEDPDAENNEPQPLAKITLSGLEKLIEQCCDCGKITKLDFSTLSEDRRVVFPAGLAILTAIFKSLNISEMEYSPSALREGVLYEMEDRLEHHDIRQRTAQSMATRYDVDIEQAQRVLATTTHLYQQCKSSWDIKRNELQSMLGWAALLHEVGLQINSRGVQKHSAYILKNTELPGFNQEQQYFLATLVAMHRKKIRKEELLQLQQFTEEETFKLIVLLRLGVLLNIHRQDDLLPNIECHAENNRLVLSFPENWLEQSILMQADLETESMRLKNIGIKLIIQ